MAECCDERAIEIMDLLVTRSHEGLIDSFKMVLTTGILNRVWRLHCDLEVEDFVIEWK